MKIGRHLLLILSCFCSVLAFLSILFPVDPWAALLPPALSGPAGKPAEPQAVSEDSLGRSTPRGTVLGFMKAAGNKDYLQALQYLDTKKTGGAAEELIVALQTILDRSFSGQLAMLSMNPAGSLNDNLPPSQERIGTVETPSGSFDILLEQVQPKTGPPLWLFSAETLKKVSARYEAPAPPAIDNYIPELLTDTRLLWLPLWQWILIILVIPLSFGLATLVTRLLNPVFLVLVRRIAGGYGDKQVVKLTGPLRILISALVLWSFSLFSSSILLSSFSAYVASTLTIIGVTWLGVRFIDPVFSLKQRRLGIASSGKISVLQLARKLSKVGVVFCGILALLFYIGNINLAAVLAGLGVGGIAVAFAAKGTLENLFDGIMVASDQPIRIGDFCRAGEHLGWVEGVGLRSTRIRTRDRTVVSVPNGQIAMMSLENFALRDKIWFYHILRLRYETTAEQLRHILEETRKMMSEHPRVESSTHRTRFVQVGNFSLDVEIFAYVLTTDWEDFLAVQEDILLRIMGVIEASGTGFAVPPPAMYMRPDDSGKDGRFQGTVLDGKKRD
jgi:MscS family membrane protein